MSQIPCPILDIPWIDPLKSPQRTIILPEEVEIMVEFIERLYRRDQWKILSHNCDLTRDDLINKGVFISSVMDLVFLYITRNDIPFEDLHYIFYVSYYFILMIYEELSYPYTSLQDLALRIGEEGSSDILKKYYLRIVNFVDFNPYAFPLTINYITRSQECLDDQLNQSGLKNFYSILNSQSLRPLFYQYSPKERIMRIIRDLMNVST